jgi:hypothetical protein
MAKQESDDLRTYYDRNFVGAWDFEKDVTLTIERVERGEVGRDKKKERAPIVYFKGTELGFKVNKTNLHTIAGMYGYKASGWKGKRITLYAAKTMFGRNEVDCIRVRPTVPKGAGERLQPKPVDEDMRAKQEAARDEADDGPDYEADEREALQAEQAAAERALGGTDAH